jgi:hypothetical protein
MHISLLFMYLLRLSKRLRKTSHPCGKCSLVMEKQNQIKSKSCKYPLKFARRTCFPSLFRICLRWAGEYVIYRLDVFFPLPFQHITGLTSSKLQVRKDLVNCWCILLGQKADEKYFCVKYMEEHVELLDFLVGW